MASGSKTDFKNGEDPTADLSDKEESIDGSRNQDLNHWIQLGSSCDHIGLRLDHCRDWIRLDSFGDSQQRQQQLQQQKQQQQKQQLLLLDFHNNRRPSLTI